MSRANQWYVPGEGIAREVITADIQRYLGPDALVRPGPGTGEHEGRNGYWITAYRTLTSQMIADLKLDSTRWQAEQDRQEAGRGVAYQDSRTHAARQHWGPSQAQEAAEQPRQPVSRAPQYASAQHAQQYASSDQHYTTSPAASYGSSSTYPSPGAYAAAPRTQPEYGGYAQQPGREHPGYATSQYSYPQHSAQDAYRQTAPPPPHGYPTTSPVAAPGFYIASDGRQYPLAQQPAQTQRQPQPRRSNP
ncbi:hypothetical protein K504DRAFT_468941 [Pleomassaria siparia CBS 279.74]|uniref:Transcription factor RfeG n=1 Tax=Pleomassaria siparia CBS 279.74 TaxID=1314801 RepID=A0A6G1KNK5_9PLEO|nr:hypothetical protein K504DRAFT_468941 [Pleomassaria siparia CBS 279.74]